MGVESQLNKTAALEAAGRLHAGASRLADVAAQSCQAVEQTQQTAPLWGGDKAGQRYRTNYAQCEQLVPAIRQLTGLLRDLGRAAEATVESLVEADERASRTFGA